MNAAKASRAAGRFCPVDYYFSGDEFTGAPLFSCKTLIVAGGMYGNPFAFEALRGLAQEEPDTKIILNGDMHWFDRTPEDFAENERRAENWLCLLGNVEAELRREEDCGAGCGCAYPPEVDDGAVERSNAMHAELKKTADTIPGMTEKLRSRAAAAVIGVNGVKVGVTHGDERSLGGWNCSLENLRNTRRRGELAEWMSNAGLSVLAVTHTCAPAAFAREGRAVINNGAAGMPPQASSRYALPSCFRALIWSRNTAAFSKFSSRIASSSSFFSFVSCFSASLTGASGFLAESGTRPRCATWPCSLAI